MNLIASMTARWAPSDRTCLRTPDARWTFGELRDAIARARRLLVDQGVQPGQVVAVQPDRNLESVALMLGCMAHGVTLMPVNPRFPVSEVEGLLQDALPAWAILQDEPYLQLGRSLARATPMALLPGMLSTVPPLEQEPSEASAPALLCYTSGTTGAPKGVPLHHRHVLATLRALHEAWGWREDDVLLHALPLFHIHGLIVALLGALHAGAAVLLEPGFDPIDVWARIEEERATVLMGVPTFYHRLLRVPLPTDLSSLRLCTSGSAPLPASLHQRFEEATGQRIVERYGMTEVGIIFSNPIDGPVKPGSVGLPLPGVEARICDVATDEPLPRGETGQVLVRGPSVFDGYRDRPEATRQALLGGWMHTGDLGHLDEDGYLFLQGRHKDLILVGGFNVYPPQVEAVLREHPAVEQAAVVALPDRELGQRPAAHVVLKAPATEDELLAHCRGHLAAYKVPRVVMIDDDLPRNAMGKVQKHVLRARWRAPVVRLARPGDLDRLVVGARRLALESEDLTLDEATVREGVRRGLQDDPPCTWYVVEHGGGYAGQFMIVEEWSDWRAKSVWWLQSLWLKPSLRGLGLYRSIHQQLLTLARHAGAAGLRLYVDRTNTHAAEVYEHMGMSDAHYRLFEQMFEG